MKLTRSTERTITADWHGEFPELGIFRARHQLRRTGPLLVGVCLDRDSGGEVYMPCFHVHFLGKEFPVVSLTMRTPLRSRSGGPDFVTVAGHREHYENAARRLKEQMPFPIDGPITLGQVVRAYRMHAETPLGRRQVAHLFGDVILLLSWCCRCEEAESTLDELLRTTSDEWTFQTFGGRSAFEGRMRRAIDGPIEVERCIESQIDALNVGKLPVDDLIRDVGSSSIAD